MKRFDSAVQAAEADSTASYFSNGLLAKIIPSDQGLARPTEQVLRRRWVKRMILAEIGFVLGVALLQFFPVLEDSSTVTSTQPMPTVTLIAPTATAAPRPEATETSSVTFTTIAPLPAPARASVVPAALPHTTRDSAAAAQLYAAPLFSSGGRPAL